MAAGKAAKRAQMGQALLGTGTGASPSAGGGKEPLTVEQVKRTVAASRLQGKRVLRASALWRILSQNILVFNASMVCCRALEVTCGFAS